MYSKKGNVIATPDCPVTFSEMEINSEGFSFLPAHAMETEHECLVCLPSLSIVDLLELVVEDYSRHIYLLFDFVIRARLSSNDTELFNVRRVVLIHAMGSCDYPVLVNDAASTKSPPSTITERYVGWKLMRF